MKDAIAALFASRKFLIVALALVACTALVALGKLPTEHFVTTLTALVGTLTVAIAIEDHGTKAASIAAAAPPTTPLAPVARRAGATGTVDTPITVVGS